jgi:hypothetical protein
MVKTKKSKPTEFSKVYKEWSESVRGKKCREGKTEGQYLTNRLFIAFSAGWIAGKTHPND